MRRAARISGIRGCSHGGVGAPQGVLAPRVRLHTQNQAPFVSGGDGRATRQQPILHRCDEHKSGGTTPRARPKSIGANDERCLVEEDRDEGRARPGETRAATSTSRGTTGKPAVNISVGLCLPRDAETVPLLRAMVGSALETFGLRRRASTRSAWP